MSSNPLGLSLQSPIVDFLLAVGAVIFCVPVGIWVIHRVKRGRKALAERVHEKMKEAAREHNLQEAAESGSSHSENSSDSEWDVEHAIGQKVRTVPVQLACGAASSLSPVTRLPVAAPQLPQPQWMQERAEQGTHSRGHGAPGRSRQNSAKVAAEAVKKAAAAAASLPSTGALLPIAGAGMPRRDSLQQQAAAAEAEPRRGSRAGTPAPSAGGAPRPGGVARTLTSPGQAPRASVRRNASM